MNLYARRCADFGSSLLLIAGLLAGCSNRSSIHEQRVRAQCPSRENDDFYFPASDNPSPVPWVATKYLKQFGESSFSCGETNHLDEYRLLYLGSAKVTLIRIERIQTGARLTYKQLESVTGSQFVEPIERMLDDAQWKSVADAVKTAGFWTNPGDVASQPVDALALLEGQVDGRYRVVTRVGEGPSANNIPAVAQAFFKLSGVPIK